LLKPLLQDASKTKLANQQRESAFVALGILLQPREVIRFRHLPMMFAEPEL
jgi:hypothetical protein